MELVPSVYEHPTRTIPALKFVEAFLVAEVKNRLDSYMPDATDEEWGLIMEAHAVVVAVRYVMTKIWRDTPMESV